MNQQRAHQKAFLTYAFGGYAQYSGRTMREAHRNLVEKHGLTGEHLDAVAENLVATLQEMGVAPALIAEVAAIVADPQNRREVLNQ